MLPSQAAPFSATPRASPSRHPAPPATQANVAAALAGLAAGVFAAQSPALAGFALVALVGANAAFAPPAPLRWGLLLLGLGFGLFAWRTLGPTGLALAVLIWRAGAESLWAAQEARRRGAAAGPLAGLGPWAMLPAGLGLCLAHPGRSLAGLPLPALEGQLALSAGLLGISALLAMIWVFGRLVQHGLGESWSGRDLHVCVQGALICAALAVPVDIAAGLCALSGWRLALTLARGSETPPGSLRA